MALVIAGERSGVGKTTVTLMLLAGLRRRGWKVQSYKVGPDYIDPMFHGYVTGRACRNLDPILTDEAYVQSCFRQHLADVDCAVVEGVMGLFDGVIGSGGKGIPWGSTAHVAKLINTPVALVLDCSRMSGSVAAVAYGFATLHPNLNIAGLILNSVASDRHLAIIEDALSGLGLPILGVLRRETDIRIPDRHLGLVPTEELGEIDHVMGRLADLADTCFDWEKLLPLLRIKPSDRKTEIQSKIVSSVPKVRILIARDRAFNFYYQDNLDLLAEAGAELVFWSPLTATEFPENIQGMYLGGGFPEVFAQKLSANQEALLAVKQAIFAGIPTLAECGGLMYLCEQIIDFAGNQWPMVGVLPTTAIMGQKLKLGYRRAICLENSLFGQTGEVICGHEFHRSDLQNLSSTPLFKTYRVDTAEFVAQEGWHTPANLHASYIHTHWGNNPSFVQRFLDLVRKFGVAE